MVGFIKNYENIELKLNSDEVEQVFTVPLSYLSSDKSKRYTQFRHGIKSPGYSIPVFLTEFEKIWGITAVLTHLFLSSMLNKELYSNHFKYIKDYKDWENTKDIPNSSKKCISYIIYIHFNG